MSDYIPWWEKWETEGDGDDIMWKEILKDKRNVQTEKRGSGSSSGLSETKKKRIEAAVRFGAEKADNEVRQAVEKLFMDMEEKFPAPVPPPDLEDKYKDDGYLVWMRDDDSGANRDLEKKYREFDGYSEESPLVVRMREIKYKNLLAEKAEEKDILKRRISRMLKQGKVIPQLKTSSEGYWVHVVTKPLMAYCEICKADCDHVDYNCPYNEDRVSTTPSSVLCKICMKLGHSPPVCPYLDFVPRECHKELGPGGVLVCKCCGDPKGHPEHTEWIGRAVYQICRNCAALADHSTKDCPDPKTEKSPFCMPRCGGCGQLCFGKACHRCDPSEEDWLELVPL